MDDNSILILYSKNGKNGPLFFFFLHTESWTLLLLDGLRLNL